MSDMNSIMIRRQRHRGFTLLEVLVTIVIVSIGLLGLLGLQTVSLVNTQVSAARSQASMAADNMAGRMRANPDGARNKEYDSVANPAAGSAPDPLCDSGTSCTAAEMAAFDAWAWDRSLSSHENDDGNRVSGLLPGGAGYIDCIQSKDKDCVTYRITIAWRERDRVHERNEGKARDLCDYKQLTGRCFSTLVRP